MRTIETDVFKLDELSDQAKEAARQWYREGGFDYEWWDCTYEDAKECGKIIGIQIDRIYFSGFWSQGDGACFEGSYEYAKGSSKAIRQHAPKDEKLHAIADALQAIQAKHFYGLEARVKQTGRYSHEYSTTIDVYGRDGCSVDANTDEAIADALRDFMRWIYRSLETEYEWLNADEQVDDTIRANEYTFTAEGRRFG